MVWYVEWRHPGKTGWLRTNVTPYASRAEAQQEMDYQSGRPELRGMFGMVEYHVVEETEPATD